MGGADAERAVIERLYASGNLADQSLVEELIDADRFEFVRRHGRYSGRAAVRELVDWVQRQHEQFAVTFAVEGWETGPDGAHVALVKAMRRGHDPALGELTSWTAHVWRVQDGKAVFFEAYANRDDALRAAGIEAPSAR